MFSFPLTFRDENEDYVTLPPLKEFSKEHNIKDVKSNSRKAFIANAIERFANENVGNEEITDVWLDDCIKEGRKDINIRSIYLSEQIKKKLLDLSYLEERLSKYMPEKGKRHISKNRYTNDYTLYKYEIINGEYGARIVFHMCRMVTFVNSEKVKSGQWYPVTCEILVEKNLIVSRVKSKSKIYDYGTGDEPQIVVRPEKEANKASDKVLTLLGIDNINDVSIDFRKKLYNMLQRFTETPGEIVEQMHQVNDRMLVVADEIRNNICNVDDVYKDDIIKDIYNLVEKYISISKTDKSIFINGKVAYPIKMVATDEEDSVLQQASALEKPLQSRAVFFDNKKMLQKNEKCDGILFSFQKVTCDDRYLARITASSTTNCTIKLYDFVKEEDINESLFTFINS